MSNSPNKTQAGQNGNDTLVVDLGAASLKADLAVKVREFGFGTLTDGVRTVIRDIVAGRIQYRNGILQSQGKTSPS